MVIFFNRQQCLSGAGLGMALRTDTQNTRV
jgi:hypothetical protein